MCDNWEKIKESNECLCWDTIQRKHDVDDDHDDSHADGVAMDLSQRQNSSSMSHPKHPIGELGYYENTLGRCPHSFPSGLVHIATMDEVFRSKAWFFKKPDTPDTMLVDMVGHLRGMDDTSERVRYFFQSSTIGHLYRSVLEITELSEKEQGKIWKMLNSLSQDDGSPIPDDVWDTDATPPTKV